MRIFEQGLDRDEDIFEALTYGSPAENPELENTVREIIEDVRNRGDDAVLDQVRKFDSPNVESLAVTDGEIAKAWQIVESGVLEALKHSACNVREFHEKEKQDGWFSCRRGTMLGQIVRPIDSVGIYVPGGRAAYPSTVLMTAIPAKVAGVERIVVATPAQSDGRVPDVVLAACRVCGVNQIFKMGGASAVAALAYGTETVPRVDKIVGPGNQYVNAAKRLVYGQTGIDSLAGPSEVLIVADNSARPEWVAADLIAQAEHGGESKSVLITWSRILADKVLNSLSSLTENLPRSSYIKESLRARGAILVVDSPEDALRWTNACAPEHLQLMVSDPQEWIGNVRNAGAVFVGPYSPAPIGDYAAGPSHTLPTGTAARFSSALGVAEFQKRTSLIWYGRQEYPADASAAITIAEAEGFQGHALSLRMRYEEDD